MTAQEQKQFVKKLAQSVTNQIVDEINLGEIPMNWDGHELRQLLADRFGREVYKTVMSGSRKREYTAAVNERNI